MVLLGTQITGVLNQTGLCSLENNPANWLAPTTPNRPFAGSSNGHWRVKIRTPHQGHEDTLRSKSGIVRPPATEGPECLSPEMPTQALRFLHVTSISTWPHSPKADYHTISSS